MSSSYEMAEVFISFIAEEERVALALRALVRASKPGCDVFLTADVWQMRAGEKWLDRIEAELRNAKVVVVLLSHRSVTRPWINFEAGAAWLNRALLIPVCIRGITAKELPKPYVDLQAVQLDDDEQTYQLLRSIGTALGPGLTPPPPFLHESEYIELRAAMRSLGKVGQLERPARDGMLSRDALTILVAAANTPSGQIIRHDLAQALVIKIGDEALTASIAEGRRRAELEGALSDLESQGLIEDISGRRIAFALTRSGYERAGGG